MRALVMGTGVAGLTAAYWLAREGCAVQLVDRVPLPGDRRMLVGLYGAGFDAADDLGIMAELQRCSADVARWSIEDWTGLPVFAVEFDAMRRRLFGGRHVTVMVDDIRRALLGLVSREVPVRWGLPMMSIKPIGPRVSVALADGSSSTYDFVVDAGDALAWTRRYWLGGPPSAVHHLGLESVSFSTYDPLVRAAVGEDCRLISAPGRQVTVCPGPGHRVNVGFLHECGEPLPDRSVAGVVAGLRSAYGCFRGVVPYLLAAAETATDIRYDELTQVEPVAWSMGRIALVGDVSPCTSLFGSQRTSLAMVGARMLVRELVRAEGNVPRGFAAYERAIRPVVAQAHVTESRVARWSAPQSKLRMMVRDAALRASVWPMGSTLVRHAVGSTTAPALSKWSPQEQQ